MFPTGTITVNCTYMSVNIPIVTLSAKRATNGTPNAWRRAVHASPSSVQRKTQKKQTNWTSIARRRLSCLVCSRSRQPCQILNILPSLLFLQLKPEPALVRDLQGHRWLADPIDLALDYPSCLLSAVGRRWWVIGRYQEIEGPPLAISVSRLREDLRPALPALSSNGWQQLGVWALKSYQPIGFPC